MELWSSIPISLTFLQLSYAIQLPKLSEKKMKFLSFSSQQDALKPFLSNLSTMFQSVPSRHHLYKDYPNLVFSHRQCDFSLHGIKLGLGFTKK